MAKFLNVPKRTLQNWESGSMDKGSVTANVQGVMLKIEDIEAEEIRRKMPIAQSEQGLALKLSALENTKLSDVKKSPGGIFGGCDHYLGCSGRTF